MSVHEDKISIDELDQIYGQASNIFYQTSIELAKLGSKVSPLVVFAAGVICMEAGVAATYLEWSKDVIASNPFSDILTSDYIGELLNNERQFTGEYITAAGAGISLTSPLIASCINSVKQSLHSFNTDPLTASFNRVGNFLSDRFKNNNIKDVAEAIVLYREAFEQSTLEPGESLVKAWAKAESRLMEAKGLNNDLHSSSVLNAITELERNAHIVNCNPV
ncbi:hypothetical protein GCM10011607_12330 [Shewanella inventionis]|uniref:Uncharacterized protein n=1 Tax=Shewanella inventionis TaxID=1738770 RepID=A0ABQ1IV84_9GAMM|nr:hypothetical protein [Shewanella inventionis]GGB53313.1 hypothetical protein GCM10011607_12330 [Shewanella inventionis]